MIRVIPTKDWHVKYIAERMRLEEDVERAGLNKADIIEAAIRKADYVFTGVVDNEIACIWGIEQPTLLSDSAYMWLITTPLVEKHQFMLARRSQMYAQELKKHYRCIHGVVDSNFARSIKWLKWLGFTVVPNDTRIWDFEMRQS